MKKIGILITLIIIFSNPLLWAKEDENTFNNSFNNNFNDIYNNVIQMDELKVEGDVEKPLEIYIIPRADLQLEVELNDSIIKEFTLHEINPGILPQLPVSINNNLIRNDAKLLNRLIKKQIVYPAIIR